MVNIYCRNGVIKQLFSRFTLFNNVLPRWWCDFNCFRWPSNFPFPPPVSHVQKSNREKYKNKRLRIIFWLLILLTDEKERAHAWHVYELNRSEHEFEVWWRRYGKYGWGIKKIIRHEYSQEKTLSKPCPSPPHWPPLIRMIREDGGWGTCPKCGSSMMKTKYFFFGKKKCIHPECGHEI